MSTRVYTDGACSGNPGPGGWAWVVPDGPFASGPAADTTNQRMELQAVLDAVQSLDGPLEIISDSTYVVNCFRDRWWEGWLARGWVNSQKKPVANRDLWEPLIDLYQVRTLAFTWVKGHSGDEWNDVADRLAVEAARTQTPRRGDTPPTDLGAADGPALRAPRRSDPDLDGHRLLVVGLRPPDMGGYGETETAAAVRARLQAVIGAKSEVLDDLVVMTGLGLGSETLAAEAALAAGVPYIAILAHPEQDAPWPDASRKRFAELQSAARFTITLQKKTPDSKQAIGGSFKRRDAWLRRNAHEAVAVWDGKERFTGMMTRSLQDEIGEEHVWIIDPNELV